MSWKNQSAEFRRDSEELQKDSGEISERIWRCVSDNVLYQSMSTFVQTCLNVITLLLTTLNFVSCIHPFKDFPVASVCVYAWKRVYMWTSVWMYECVYACLVFGIEVYVCMYVYVYVIKYIDRFVYKYLWECTCICEYFYG